MKKHLDFPGFSSPAAGPEAPLDMLAACHTRVHKQCQTLQRLVPHLAQHGSDAAAQEAAQAVLRYFNTAAVHHHADEEQDLFPALLDAMAGSDAVCIRELTDFLKADHRQLELRWHRLRAGLEAVVTGQAHTLSADEVAAFVQAYAAHIEREDKELFPMAARLLGSDALQGIGQAMAQRRGLT